MTNFYSIFFKLGILTLPTLPFFSSIFLLISSLKIIKEKKYSYFGDTWNYPFVVTSIFLILSCLRHTFVTQNNLSDWNPSLSWIGLFNFFPFFWFFWAFQPHLNTNKDRENFAKILILGTLPLIFSVFLQWLGIFGPFTFLNGLIKWHMIETFNPPYKGIFSNQNYFALWLTLVWPFSYILILEKKKRILRIAFTTVIIALIIQTFSRNALLGLLISLPITVGSSVLVWSVPIIIFFLLIGFFSLPFAPEKFNLISKTIMPESIFLRFQSFHRLDIWTKALNFLFEKPLTGWGAATFPILYELETDNYFAHSHNLFLEIALNYGLFTSIIILTTFFFLIFRSIKVLLKRKNELNFKNIFQYKFEKAWISCAIIFFVSQFFDVQYYDLRISILGWAILSGLREIIRERPKLIDEKT